jgi:chaperonin GroEL (HSP60 family)
MNGPNGSPLRFGYVQRLMGHLGIHPIRIADGYDKACKIAVAHLDSIADTVDFSLEDKTNLLRAARTSLGSKMYVENC